MSLDDREQYGPFVIFSPNGLLIVESFTTEQDQFSENRRHKWM